MLDTYLEQNPFKRFLIFDFDGTLFDLKLPWEQYRVDVIAILHKYDANAAELAANPSKSLEEVMNELIKKHGTTLREELLAYATQFETNYLEQVDENAELLQFIETHSQDFPFYLWTSNMGMTVEPILQRRGIYDHFTEIISRDKVMLIKPDPEGFHHIYDPRHHQLRDFLLIGDSDFDRKAANSAGIDFFEVKRE